MPAARVKSRSKATSTTLQAKASPYAAGVTLYELKTEVVEETLAVSDGSSASGVKMEAEVAVEEQTALLRRSPRKRVAPSRVREDATDSLSDPPDLSDSDVEFQSKSESVPRRATQVHTPKKARTGVVPSPGSTPSSLKKNRVVSKKARADAIPSPGGTPSSLKKTRVVKHAMAVAHPEPDNWRRAYRIIKHQRDQIPAAVDTMGCHMAGRQESDPRARRLSIFVSLILSPQTKDTVTDAAMIRLRTALGGSITLNALLAASRATIASAIGSVGFWSKKTDYLMGMAKRLRDDFGGDVPRTIEDLCSILGVGEKIGFLTLAAAWDIHTGIGVDTHVHRITQRLGWHKTKPKDEDATRLNLQSWLPNKLWDDINHMLVGFGQTICQPVGPRCNECDLRPTNLCPSALSDSEIPSLKMKGKAGERVALLRVDNGRTVEDTLLLDEIEEGVRKDGDEGYRVVAGSVMAGEGGASGRPKVEVEVEVEVELIRA